MKERRISQLEFLHFEARNLLDGQDRSAQYLTWRIFVVIAYGCYIFQLDNEGLLWRHDRLLIYDKPSSRIIAIMEGPGKVHVLTANGAIYRLTSWDLSLLSKETEYAVEHFQQGRMIMREL